MPATPTQTHGKTRLTVSDNQLSALLTRPGGWDKISC